MFKMVSNNARINKMENNAKKREAKQLLQDAATSIVFVTLAENGDIDTVTASEHRDMFADWTSKTYCKAGALRKYDGTLYQCVQAHTSQDDWTPDATPSLWTKVSAPNEEFPSWSQPVGAHDAYTSGDNVTHNDKKWISVVEGNVWEPGVFGWNEVT